MPSSSCPARGRAQWDKFAEAAANLSEAPLAAVLLYALALDDEDPALGVLLGARRELGLIASLVEVIQSGIDFDFTALVPVLEGIGRRLDAAIELINRAKRAERASKPPPNEELPSAPTGGDPMAAEFPGATGAKS
jgi:hypothetical protein